MVDIAELNVNVSKLVSDELVLPLHKVTAVNDLLDAGNTVPFIARYRKEATGNLDEVQIRDVQTRTKGILEVQARKQTVYRAISEQGALTDTLFEHLKAAVSMQQIEDLYLPYKQKRRTKAVIAKESGLMGLANFIQRFPASSIEAEAHKYLNSDYGVNTIEDALAGVHEIFAEVIGESAGLREWVRNFTRRNGQLTSKIKRGAKDKDEQGVFELYYDFTMPLKTIANHQVLAINRGENLGILSGSIAVETDVIDRHLIRVLVGDKTGQASEILQKAAQDAYKRFIGPAIEREIRKTLFETAAADAIKVFGTNLYHLLMAAPLHGQVVLGFDPGIRTGSKLAVVDENGKFLEKAVIYPHRAQKYDPVVAKKTIIDLVKRYHVTLVAIGNGTASRESQQFIADIIKNDLPMLKYAVVNESGASVYSASDVAREEFPDLQVEQRSAISIARRLQDPMAELIKIDPQAVGVGQYQHDLPVKELTLELDAVLETAVNQVGVNLNTASQQLLVHIAGLSKTTAANIVAYRDKHGRFMTRKELTKVSKLGPKAYEQAAGFLRIPEGTNPLDNTDIHPESYQVVTDLLKQVGVPLVSITESSLRPFVTEQVASELEIGLSTLQDIVASLLHSGRDLRATTPTVILRSDVLTMKDLSVGMQLQGTVRNVVDFGAFVDIGVHEDGLVHLSKMVDQANKHWQKINPHQIVVVGDIVTVWVTEIDLKRNRIGLTMIAPN